MKNVKMFSIAAGTPTRGHGATGNAKLRESVIEDFLKPHPTRLCNIACYLNAEALTGDAAV